MGAGDLGYDFHGGVQERRQLRVLRHLDALQALGEDKQALVGHAHDFVHDRQASYREQVGRLRRIHARLALRYHNDGLVFTQGVDQLHRTFPPHGQRQYRMREQNGVAYGQNGQGPGGGCVVAKLRIDRF